MLSTAIYVCTFFVKFLFDCTVLNLCTNKKKYKNKLFFYVTYNNYLTYNYIRLIYNKMKKYIYVKKRRNKIKIDLLNLCHHNKVVIKYYINIYYTAGFGYCVFQCFCFVFTYVLKK